MPYLECGLRSLQVVFPSRRRQRLLQINIWRQAAARLYGQAANFCLPVILSEEAPTAHTRQENPRDRRRTSTVVTWS
ncbi:hypothetical protein Zmor_022415 [Zophobas morio]|uniref:Uncharacterized protein n=1 Tax=Zophobas morio TaxID=2755281 RepID=A0AA38M5E0_9CUCU|nr:hypothetical protein Zmor_022415 [Zophobas morio]